ncbi:MAG TPA: queuosine precursor transporter [Wenzhouxiangella sp.]|nr:queuosine precursor transporter [Wenzhouxiangella sp.]
MPILIGSMVAIVASANYLVQFPLNDWLTLGALTYPVAFFVTDVANRRYGPGAARKVVYSGFVPGLLISIWLSSPRIAFASGSAFLIAQLLDVAIFNHLRQRVWWQPPLISTVFSSVVDTAWFFVIAFVGTGMPWVTLAVGDYFFKVGFALLLLLPWRIIVAHGKTWRNPA